MRFCEHCGTQVLVTADLSGPYPYQYVTTDGDVVYWCTLRCYREDAD